MAYFEKINKIKWQQQIKFVDWYIMGCCISFNNSELQIVREKKIIDYMGELENIFI